MSSTTKRKSLIPLDGLRDHMKTGVLWRAPFVPRRRQPHHAVDKPLPRRPRAPAKMMAFERSSIVTIRRHLTFPCPDHLHQAHRMVCVDDGSATAASGRNDELLKETRRPHRPKSCRPRPQKMCIFIISPTPSLAREI